jgi:two-component system, NarL family, nitrate/nitrite response regulator NarL
MKTRIFIIDDHAIMLDGIESLLASSEEVLIAGKTTDPKFCLSFLRIHPVDILITDYSMPGMSGLQLLQQARKIYPSIKIIFLSMHDEEALVQEAIRSGADGYILKKYAYQEVMQAITVVRNGGQYWSPEVNRILTRALRTDEQDVELTERETEILKLLVQELTTRQIADRLFISERTIDSHRKNLLRKTNSKNTVGLIKFAYSRNLL